ncbi:helix-turn-helix domain-containing protein [Zhongshania sp.]|uniref:MerR family transcriptional regulator n=1 Tax=Zhongshania sp. TaxID=1971902 RepID=UPI00356284D1
MSTKATTYSRAQVAKSTDVNSETIRYYEDYGLIKPPTRSAGGHRMYTKEHVLSLTFIRRSRELGFTLHEIKSLIDLSDDSEKSCTQVRDLSAIHLTDIKTKIKDLKKMEKTLTEMIKQCDANTSPACPIIDVLSS